MIAHVLFLSVCGSLLVVGYRGIRQGHFYRVATSSFAAAIYLTCMWLPGLLQVNGQLTSKLYRAGVLQSLTSDGFAQLAARWTLELSLVAGAQGIVLYARRGERSEGEDADSFERWVPSVYIMLLVGAVFLATSQVTLENRGVGGVGVLALLASFFASGLALIGYYWPRHPIPRVVLFCGIAILLGGYVRSPLVIVAVAIVAGAIQRGTVRSRRSILALLTASILLVLAGSAISAIRGNLIRDDHANGNEVSATFQNPLVAPFQEGVDTLDGYRLSEDLHRRGVVEPRPADPLMAIAGYIPRTIWKNKPNEISVDVSRIYLGYGASGQFLSPVGYLTLATGQYWLALIVLSAFCAGATVLSVRFKIGVWCVPLWVVLFRFFLGGGAFDIAYGLRIAIPWIVIGGILGVGRQSRQRGTPPIAAVEVRKISKIEGSFRNPTANDGTR